MGECSLLLLSFFFIARGCGRYVGLRLDPGKGHIVRGVYHSMLSMVQIERLVFCEILWNKKAPLKVSLFAYLWFQNRLPTKDNMVHHGIIMYSANQPLIAQYTLRLWSRNNFLLGYIKPNTVMIKLLIPTFSCLKVQTKPSMPLEPSKLVMSHAFQSYLFPTSPTHLIPSTSMYPSTPNYVSLAGSLLCLTNLTTNKVE